jgi:hypothetical protein
MITQKTNNTTFFDTAHNDAPFSLWSDHIDCALMKAGCEASDLAVMRSLASLPRGQKDHEPCEVWTSQKDLAQRIGYGDRLAIASLKRLEKLGLIRRTKKGNAQTHEASVYDLTGFRDFLVANPPEKLRRKPADEIPHNNVPDEILAVTETAEPKTPIPVTGKMKFSGLQIFPHPAGKYPGPAEIQLILEAWQAEIANGADEEDLFLAVKGQASLMRDFWIEGKPQYRQKMTTWLTSGKWRESLKYDTSLKAYNNSKTVWAPIFRAWSAVGMEFYDWREFSRMGRAPLSSACALGMDITEVPDYDAFITEVSDYLDGRHLSKEQIFEVFTYFYNKAMNINNDKILIERKHPSRYDLDEGIAEVA